MKKLYAVALCAALTIAALSTVALTADDNSSSSNVAVPIGSTIEDFKLPDASGKQHSLASLKGKNGTVLIFVSVQCPISNAYNARMAQLAKDYAARGITVVGINSNVAEAPDAIKQHAAQNNLDFPILKDAGNRIADRLNAQVTPEAYLLDASNRLVYRGRIDNSRNGDQINSQELREAIDATLAGNAVAKP
jgi:peroxiredoxin